MSCRRYSEGDRQLLSAFPRKAQEAPFHATRQGSAGGREHPQAQGLCSLRCFPSFSIFLENMVLLQRLGLKPLPQKGIAVIRIRIRVRA